MKGLRENDRQTILKMYNEYYPLLRKFVIANSGSETEAKDLFQECMVYLYQLSCRESIPPIENLKAYFIGMFRNRWFVQLKKQKKHADFVATISTEFIEESDESYNLYLRAFQRLGDDCKTILNMYVDGQKNDDLARFLKTSLDYAKRKKYLCKEKLKSIVKDMSKS